MGKINAKPVNVPVEKNYQPDEYNFIIIGDTTQYWQTDIFFEMMKKLKNDIEIYKPEFIIHAGDMICGAGYGYTSASRARELWERDVFVPLRFLISLGVRFFPVFGNHDDNEYDWAWKKYIENSEVQVGPNVPYNYSFAFGSTYFIIYDFRASVAVLAWLRSQVKAAEQYDMVFVFSHIPLVSFYEPDDEDSEGRCEEIAPIFQPIKHKLLSVSGHNHIFDMRILEGECGGIHQLITGGGGSSIDEHRYGGETEHHFVWISVKGKEFELKKIDFINGKFIQTVPDDRWVGPHYKEYFDSSL